ncbi:M20 family metallopeptidase [Bacillus kexueae]|uniref:M20 family metallopeptidase n=1 Tax=Aeribacillus kexueae TaxID=2078952 RepID=UPI001FAEDA00|nr:M20 family metallopeptidase [Bacillus kexueae]
MIQNDQTIESFLDEQFDQMVEWRRHFHQYPELSFQEEKTPAKIAEILTSYGIDVKTGVGGRGVVGYIKGKKPGKTVALRADFDALAIQDEKEVDYKSKIPGVMHACGHDAHTATLLGVAAYLSERKEELQGNVVLIFQFAEEITPGGAKPMIEDGCLEGVDVIFGTHLWATMPVGEIGYRSGALMAAADRFTITIHGKGGHGASPHETIDSIAVGTSLVQQLQQIVSRRLNPLHPAVLTVATFHAGNAFNVIADSATITGTVRTFQPEVQEKIIEEIEKITKSVCEGANATYSLKYEKGYPALVNHPEETAHLVKSAKKWVEENNIHEMEPVMGGEDFAYYLQNVPGTFFFTGAGNEEVGASYPHHHPKFNIDERAMIIAAKILITATIDYLQHA